MEEILIKVEQYSDDESDKIYAFQCLFCFMKFELGENLEGRLLDHYYGLHEARTYQCKNKLNATGRIDSNNDFFVKSEAVEAIETVNEIETDVEIMYDNTIKEDIMSDTEFDGDNNKYLLAQKDKESKIREKKIVNKFFFTSQDSDYPCVLCSESFNDDEVLQNHLQQEHPIGGNMPCDLCDKECNTRFNLLNHRQTHKNINIQCKLCGRMFYLLAKCKNHLESAHGIKDEFESYITDVNIHKKALHQCKYCLKHFNKKSGYINHELIHEEPKFHCTECTTRFHTYSSFKIHMKERHAILISNEASQELLKEYRSKHLVRKQRLVQCKLCDERFCLVTECIEHLSNVHQIADYEHENFIEDLNKKACRYKCTFCFKSFNKKSDFSNHKRIHLDPEFQCKVCNKMFKVYQMLKRHLKMQHNENIDFPNPDSETVRSVESNQPSKSTETIGEGRATGTICELCGKVFKSPHYMDVHLKRHKGIMYECDICNKLFAFKVYLKKHIRMIHTKQKNFCCDLCPATYSERPGIQYHMITAHSISTPFQCNLCDQKFKVEKNLKSHLLSHSNIRKYECKPCGKLYRQSSSRKKHNKTVHGIALTKIPLNDIEM